MLTNKTPPKYYVFQDHRGSCQLHKWWWWDNCPGFKSNDSIIIAAFYSQWYSPLSQSITKWESLINSRYKLEATGNTIFRTADTIDHRWGASFKPTSNQHAQQESEGSTKGSLIKGSFPAWSHTWPKSIFYLDNKIITLPPTQGEVPIHMSMPPEQLS